MLLQYKCPKCMANIICRNTMKYCKSCGGKLIKPVVKLEPHEITAQALAKDNEIPARDKLDRFINTHIADWFDISLKDVNLLYNEDPEFLWKSLVETGFLEKEEEELEEKEQEEQNDVNLTI